MSLIWKKLIHADELFVGTSAARQICSSNDLPSFLKDESGGFLEDESGGKLCSERSQQLLSCWLNDITSPSSLEPIGGGVDYTLVLRASSSYTEASTVSAIKTALAAASSGDVVFIPGTADLDFTGEYRILIPDGVTLASDRGYSGSEGAKITYGTTFNIGGNISSFSDEAGDIVRATTTQAHGLIEGTNPNNKPQIQINNTGLGYDTQRYLVDVIDSTHFEFDYGAAFPGTSSTGDWTLEVDHDCLFEAGVEASPSTDAGTRISGIRFYGPGSRLSDDTTCGCIRTFSGGVEIDNCEFTQWGKWSIDLINDRNHHIHHNHIHDTEGVENTPGGSLGFGYGVWSRGYLEGGTVDRTGTGDVSIIEYNLFSNCRHEVGSAGSTSGAYLARGNLVWEHVGSEHNFDRHSSGSVTNVIRNLVHQNSNDAVSIDDPPLDEFRLQGNYFLHTKMVGSGTDAVLVGIDFPLQYPGMFIGSNFLGGSEFDAQRPTVTLTADDLLHPASGGTTTFTASGTDTKGFPINAYCWITGTEGNDVQWTSTGSLTITYGAAVGVYPVSVLARNAAGLVSRMATVVVEVATNTATSDPSLLYGLAMHHDMAEAEGVTRLDDHEFGYDLLDTGTVLQEVITGAVNAAGFTGPTSAAISAFADYGATVEGTVLATSAGHGFLIGETKRLTVSGTTSYNNTWDAVIVDANTFYFKDTWVSDEGGGGAQWAAENTLAIGYPDNYALNLFDQDYTISFWINIDNFTPAATFPIISCGAGGNNSRGWRINLRSAANEGINFLLNSDSRVRNTYRTSATTLSTATLYHILITHSRGGTVQIYLDNTAVSMNTTADVETVGDLYTRSALTIGEDFNGKFAMFSLWKRVLTSTERTNVYNSGTPLAYSSY